MASSKLVEFWSVGTVVVVWVSWRASSTGVLDTSSVGTAWLLSEVELMGVLITVSPLGEHDTAPAGLDLRGLVFPGSEHIRFTAVSRLGSGAASLEGSQWQDGCLYDSRSTCPLESA